MEPKKKRAWAIPWEVKTYIDSNMNISLQANAPSLPTYGDCLRPFVVGCILGDGYINKKGVLTIEHSLDQKDYVDWKFQKLKQLNVLTPACKPSLVCRIHPQTKREHKSVQCALVLVVSLKLKDPSFTPTAERLFHSISKIFVFQRHWPFGLWMMGGVKYCYGNGFGRILLYFRRNLHGFSNFER